MTELSKTALGVAVALSVCVSFAADDIEIPAPGGVGNVTALTNALAHISSYRNVLLKPGVYDLKDVKMDEDSEGSSHLSLKSGGHGIIGLGAGPEETVLLGGGSAAGCRILRLKGSSASSIACVSNLTLTGGYTTKDGGAFLGNNYAHAIDCVISNNYATGTWQAGGGAIRMGFARRCYLADNRTDGANGHHGGAMWCNDATYQGAVDCVFTNNYGCEGGGLRGAAIVRRCTFVGNTAASTGKGGGVCRASVYDCKFIENSGYAGGGLAMSAVVSNCVFVGNAARTGYTESGGGALWYEGGGTIIDCAFTNNTAPGQGGTVNLYKKEGDVVPTRFVNCTFSGSISDYSGGAIMHSGQTEVHVEGCYFTNNLAKGTANATGCGGAINLTRGYVADSTFECNEASGSAKKGGAIWCNTPGLCITNCTFRYNKASTACALGAGSRDNAPLAVGCVVSGFAPGGGSVCQYVNFEDSILTNIHTDAWIFKNCQFSRCLVADCRSTYSSGGVSVDTGDLTYTNANCIFKDNFQYINAITEAKTIINCIYEGNSSSSGAYGDIVRPGAVCYNTVFLDNRYSDKFQDFRSGKYPTMVNCTYSHINDESLPEKCSNCFKALRSDLKFSRSPATPYMPRLSSPLRDSGCSDAWIVEALGDSDFYGHARLFGGALDIGPAEYDAVGERGLSVFLR